MLTKTPPANPAGAPARTGHGAASVIARLHEEATRPQARDTEEAQAGTPAAHDPPAGESGSEREQSGA